MYFNFRPFFRITFAELSRKYPYSQTPTPAIRDLGVWLSQSLFFRNLATTTRILWCPSPAGPRAAVDANPLHIRRPRQTQGGVRKGKRVYDTAARKE